MQRKIEGISNLPCQWSTGVQNRYFFLQIPSIQMRDDDTYKKGRSKWRYQNHPHWPPIGDHHPYVMVKIHLHGDIPSIPTELLDLIGTFASVDTLLNLCRGSKHFHTITSRILYTDVLISGIWAQKLFITLGLTSANAKLYSMFIQHLTYIVTSIDDAFLAFHSFTDALIRMQRLTMLHIAIPSAYTPHLLLLLRKKELIQSYRSFFDEIHLNHKVFPGASLLTLPRLKILWVTGDVRIAQLGRYHYLTSLIMETPISMQQLANLVSDVMSRLSTGGNQFRDLEINLKDGSNVQATMAFVGLGKTFPCLWKFSFRAPTLYASVSLTTCIHLNIQSWGWHCSALPIYWHILCVYCLNYSCCL